MELFTEAITEKLINNGKRSVRDSSFDPLPVVKLFTPDASAAWLLVWLDLDDPNRAFGLCDLGLGFPELGWVPIEEFDALRGLYGLPVERDMHFYPSKPLSLYAEEARLRSCIVA